MTNCSVDCLTNQAVAADLPVLDTIANTASAVSRPTGSALRYARQAGARELVPAHRVAHCLRTPVGLAVDVLHVPGRKTGVFRGLQTCGSVWDCACCASVISERRRDELAQGIKAWRERGGVVLLLTWTIPHGSHHELKDLLCRLGAARRAFRSGRSSQHLRERYGVLLGTAVRLMTVRALEVTHGANGWHPHIHELWFVDAGLDLDEMRADLFAGWSAAVAVQGLGECSSAAFYLEDAGERVDQYVTKLGRDPSWGPEAELTKQVVKSGKSASRSPMNLLDAYVFDGDELAGALWQEYSEAFFRQKHLEWSPGLRAVLGLVEDRSDADVLAEHEHEGVVLATLTVAQWRVVVANDARAELLQVAGTGDRELVRLFLCNLGVLIDMPAVGAWARAPACLPCTLLSPTSFT